MERRAEQWQYKALGRYGLKVDGLTHGQAFGLLRCLERQTNVERLLEEYGVTNWQYTGPTLGQLAYLKRLKMPQNRAKNQREAGLLIDTQLKPLKLFKQLRRALDKAKTDEELDAVKNDLILVRHFLPPDYVQALFEAGKLRRAEVEAGDPDQE